MSRRSWCIALWAALVTVLLISCATPQSSAPQPAPAGPLQGPQSAPNEAATAAAPDFDGEAGDAIALTNGQLQIEAAGLGDREAHYYHTRLASGKTVYFFVIRDGNGVYHAAANGCQVCFAARQGFRQEGDLIVCNTCGNRYPIVRIATEKGGCNPAPISPNIQVQDGQLVLTESQLAPIARYF